MTEKAYRLQLRVIHPIISISVPSLFVVTLHALCRGSLGLPPAFPDGLILLCPLASILEAGAGNAAYANRSPPIARLREIALYLLGTIALLVLIRVPVYHLGYVGLLIVLSWGVSCAIHASLRSREDLIRSTEGKSGGELDHALHRSMLVEGDSLTRLSRVQHIAGALTGVNVAIATGLVFLGVRIRALAAGLLILQAFSRLAAGAVLNAMDADQRLLGRGMRLNPDQRARRLTLGILAMGGAIVAALAASRSSALIPVSAVGRMLERLAQAIRARGPIFGPGLRALIERLLAWLARLFPRGGPVGGLPMGQPFLPVAGEPSLLARRVLFALGMTLLAVGVGAAVAFLTAPLGDRDTREGLTRKRPLRFLLRRVGLLLVLARRLGRSIRSSLRELIRETRRLSPRAALPVGQHGNESSVGTAARRSGSRARRERSLRQRARRAYARIALWTRGLGMQPTPALAPLELARQAGGLARGQADRLRSAAEMVERVLYAGQPAADALVADLERLVRAIVRARVEVGGPRLPVTPQSGSPSGSRTPLNAARDSEA